MNEMFLSRVLSQPVIDELISRYFSIPTGTLAYVSEFEDLCDQSGRVVLLQEIGGSFPQQISLYHFPETCDSELAAFLAQEAKLDALYSDDTVNPYRWMVHSQGQTRAVFVDPEVLDVGAFKLSE